MSPRRAPRLDEAAADDGAIHREWPRLAAYVAAHPDVDLDDARAFVDAVRVAVES